MDYYVDNLVGDEDDACGFLAGEPPLAAAVGLDGGEGFRLADAGGELKGETHLAVEGDGIGEGILDEHRRVVGGPGGIADGGGVAQLMVDLLGYVRGKGGQEHGEGFHHLLGDGTPGQEVAHGDHEGADGGVEGEAFDVVGDFLDGLVDELELLLVGRGVGAGLGEFPEFFEETEYTFDAVGVPGLGLLDGAEEHLVEAEGVGTVARHKVVGVLDVEH